MSAEGFDHAGKPIESVPEPVFLYRLYRAGAWHSDHKALRKAQRSAASASGAALEWTYTPPLYTWWYAEGWAIRLERVHGT